METISDIYAAINPLPAMLSGKGKVKPEASLSIEANAQMRVSLNWVKATARNNWDRDYKSFSGDTADKVVTSALEFINAMPDAKTARLHDFMMQLGKVIDSGRDLGIEVDYLNPLTETMKRLSENVITHQQAEAA